MNNSAQVPKLSRESEELAVDEKPTAVQVALPVTPWPEPSSVKSTVSKNNAPAAIDERLTAKQVALPATPRLKRKLQLEPLPVAHRAIEPLAIDEKPTAVQVALPATPRLKPKLQFKPLPAAHRATEPLAIDEKPTAVQVALPVTPWPELASVKSTVSKNNAPPAIDEQPTAKQAALPVTPRLKRKLQFKPVPTAQGATEQLAIDEKPTSVQVALPAKPFPLAVPVTPLPDTIPVIEQGTKESTTDPQLCRVRLLPVMTSIQKVQYAVLILLWIGVNLFFWSWWLQVGHIGNPILFTLITLAFCYEVTLLPSVYTFYLGQMRRPAPIDAQLARQAGVVKKVAVISLTVPGSESLEFVKRQMLAIKNIRYPHDSWILVDKVHSPEIEVLAESLGVRYFSRHDHTRWSKEQIAAWNRPTPPFKAKTKAGNVNSWIDAHGHAYSHFTQLDIDHLPVTSYLDRVLGFFLDPKVKWVQAPSVYGNLDIWTARGSAEQEFVLQGPLQMGFFGFCRTPFIIGSHSTYDMAAIRQIGGFQPTRAEDHLDTVFLAAQGYQGVFVPEVIAVGDGPENFETYLAQQFAWAFSMIQVLFTFTAKCIKNYTPRQAVQFLFVQTWYTFWCTAMLLLFSLPLIALFTNTSIAHVSYWQFLLHSLPITVTAFIIWLWSHPWHFPQNLELSWRGILLHIARWPLVLSALIQVLLRVEKPYMITVKGLQQGQQRPFSLGAHAPYFVLIGISLGACWFYLLMVGQSDAQGYLLFALQGAMIFLLLYISALVKDISGMIQEGIALWRCLLLRTKPLLVLMGILVIFSWTAIYSADTIYAALLVTR